MNRQEPSRITYVNVDRARRPLLGVVSFIHTHSRRWECNSHAFFRFSVHIGSGGMWEKNAPPAPDFASDSKEATVVVEDPQDGRPSEDVEVVVLDPQNLFLLFQGHTNEKGRLDLVLAVRSYYRTYYRIGLKKLGYTGIADTSFFVSDGETRVLSMGDWVASKPLVVVPGERTPYIGPNHPDWKPRPPNRPR